MKKLKQRAKRRNTINKNSTFVNFLLSSRGYRGNVAGKHITQYRSRSKEITFKY